jgi:hypothetical protein
MDVTNVAIASPFTRSFSPDFLLFLLCRFSHTLPFFVASQKFTTPTVHRIHFSSSFNFPERKISFAATACEFFSKCWPWWLLSYSSAWSLCMMDGLVSVHVERWMLHVLAIREYPRSRIVLFKHDTDTPRLENSEKKNYTQNLLFISWTSWKK